MRSARFAEILFACLREARPQAGYEHRVPRLVDDRLVGEHRESGADARRRRDERQREQPSRANE
jgi:hypothetical protein